AAGVANLVLFLVTSAVAMNVAHHLSNSSWVLLLIPGVGFGVARAFARRWSQWWVSVAVPAAVVALATVTVLPVAVYVGDGGDPSIMWRYIPGPEGTLATAIATASPSREAFFGARAIVTKKVAYDVTPEHASPTEAQDDLWKTVAIWVGIFLRFAGPSSR